MFKNSLAYKINFSILILLLFILGSSLYSIIVINRIQGYADNTRSNLLPHLMASDEVHDNFVDFTRKKFQILAEKNTEQKNLLIEQEEQVKVAFEKSLENFEKLTFSREEKSILSDINDLWEEYLETSQDASQLFQEGKDKEASRLLFEKGEYLFKKIKEGIGKLNGVAQKGMLDATDKGASIVDIANTVIVIAVIVALLASVFIFRIVVTSTNNMKKSIINLRENSMDTQNIGLLLKNGSHALSGSVAEQSASIHETSAAINQITSMVNRTAENARESTTVAKSASAKAQDGQKTMERLVAAMETIQESNNHLQNIANIISQINSKTAVINDIVSKTELLSLNASIESARAGEYGKGFAVVAEEVGNLAKVSGKSAHDIQELITTSQEQVNQILEITKNRVIEGKKVTIEAQDCFQRIAEDISTMSSSIEQIFEATKEQEQGIKQISSAMLQIDRAVQRSQNAVNTSAESSANLVEQSQKIDATARTIEALILGTKTQLS